MLAGEVARQSAGSSGVCRRSAPSKASLGGGGCSRRLGSLLYARGHGFLNPRRPVATALRLARVEPGRSTISRGSGDGLWWRQRREGRRPAQEFGRLAARWHVEQVVALGGFEHRHEHSQVAPQRGAAQADVQDEHGCPVLDCNG